MTALKMSETPGYQKMTIPTPGTNIMNISEIDHPTSGYQDIRNTLGSLKYSNILDSLDFNFLFIRCSAPSPAPESLFGFGMPMASHFGSIPPPAPAGDMMLNCIAPTGPGEPMNGLFGTPSAPGAALSAPSFGFGATPKPGEGVYSVHSDTVNAQQTMRMVNKAVKMNLVNFKTE